MQLKGSSMDCMEKRPSTVSVDNISAKSQKQIDIEEEDIAFIKQMNIAGLVVIVNATILMLLLFKYL